MRLSSPLVSVVALSLAAIVAQACMMDPTDDKACTMIGCSNGFAIALQASDWQPGTYQVELITDGRVVRCTAPIPLPKGNPGQVCDAQDVQLGLSGSELPVQQQSLSEVRFLETLPKMVQVTVSRDTTILAVKTFTPTYQTTQPNGPDCEPTCTNASALLSW